VNALSYNEFFLLAYIRLDVNSCHKMTVIQTTSSHHLSSCSAALVVSHYPLNCSPQVLMRSVYRASTWASDRTIRLRCHQVNDQHTDVKYQVNHITSLQRSRSRRHRICSRSSRLPCRYSVPRQVCESASLRPRNNTSLAYCRQHNA